MSIFAKSDRISSETWTNITARYAHLFVHRYLKNDVNGIQVTVTAFTHLYYAMHHALVESEGREAVVAEFLHYVRIDEHFPDEDLPYILWLLNHFFEIEQENNADFMMPWYQKLDDEWVVRQQLRKQFPDKRTTEVTALLLQQASSME